MFDVLEKRKVVVVVCHYRKTNCNRADRIVTRADRGGTRCSGDLGDIAERHIGERYVMPCGNVVDVNDKADVVDVVWEDMLELVDIASYKGCALLQKLVAYCAQLGGLCKCILVRGLLRLECFGSLICRVGIQHKHADSGYEQN